MEQKRRPRLTLASNKPPPPRFTIPRRRIGYQSPDATLEYLDRVEAAINIIEGINSRLPFKVSARGWCYLMENAGHITKGQFDDFQRFITDCREKGFLPLDFVAEDEEGAFKNEEQLNHSDPCVVAEGIIGNLLRWHEDYTPRSFWLDQGWFIMMLVEKVDLLTLFQPICAEYHIMIANAGGWNTLNQRGTMARMFKRWQRRGKRCVLLYCGDHDPVGLQMSDVLKNNFKAIEGATGWDPFAGGTHALTVDRFGLNYDFIEEHHLPWIPNLKTGKGKDLGDATHKWATRKHIQAYVQRYGKRKLEANALVVNPEIGRNLCRRAILKYLPGDAPQLYEAVLAPYRQEMNRVLIRFLHEVVR